MDEEGGGPLGLNGVSFHRRRRGRCSVFSSWTRLGRYIGQSRGKRVAALLRHKGLDLLDYCLDADDEDYADYAAELEEILARSGSAWTVGTDHEQLWCLIRRVDETVLEAATEEAAEQRCGVPTERLVPRLRPEPEPQHGLW